MKYRLIIETVFESDHELSYREGNRIIYEVARDSHLELPAGGEWSCVKVEAVNE